MQCFNGKHSALIPQVMDFDAMTALFPDSLDFDRYPDPIVDYYGWSFTGSIDGEDCVQFFEKDANLGSNKRLILPGDSNHSDDRNNTVNDDVSIGPFFLVKLDFYFLTGAIRTVVDYPATYDRNGSIVNPAWSSTLYFDNYENRIDTILFHQLLMDPVSVHRRHDSCTNVAALP